MLFGSHVSAAGGVEKAPERAQAVGCEVFQFFSRSPQGGSAPKLTSQIIKDFKGNCKKYKQTEIYIHAPYYINLASPKNNVRYASSAVIREELERGSILGSRYVMAHLGSARDVGEEQGLKYVIQGLKRVLDDYIGSTQFLIELSAGAGMVIGDKFEEVTKIIKQVEQGNKKLKNTIGVCFDTCHVFASGYDLQTKDAVSKTLEEFDDIIGLDRLKLIHCNDSRFGLGEHKDRHEHLGKGKIGLAGFKALVQDKRLKNANFVIETPKDAAGDDPKNLAILKKFRGK